MKGAIQLSFETIVIIAIAVILVVVGVLLVRFGVIRPAESLRALGEALKINLTALLPLP